jgi:DNA invertase Pin-like site-specific DNA recombinase
LSSDPDGTSTATERQRQDCQRLADARGYEVVDVYEDNDTSAYKRGVVRPAFERMLTDLAGGAIDAVVVWRTDRLARQPRDLERFIDAAEAHQGGLLSVTEPDFSGSSGLLILRMLTAFANHESGVKAERVARKMKELAERGEPRSGGQRSFGYNRDMTPNVREAEVFVASVFLILKGESYSSVMAQWTAAGFTTPTGKQWRLTNWCRMLTAPVFAGLRSYHGELLAGNWQGLITPELREQLIAVIGGRHQAQQRKVSVHLLTGIAQCSCGAPMNGTSRPGHGGKAPHVEYRCNVLRGGCGHTTIRANKLEPPVVERFFELASSREELDAVDPTAVLLALRQDEANLAQLVHDHYVERIIDRAAFIAAKKHLDERIDERRTLVARAGPMSWLRDTGAAHREWERRDLTWRREMLRAVVRVVVAPAGHDRYKDRVTISPARNQMCPSSLDDITTRVASDMR